MAVIIIAFYGGPGSGKSSIAYKLAGALKSKHINCELVTEVAKDVTWEQNFHQLKNQLFIVAKQFDRIRRLEDKVNYIIMDAGLLQNIPYFKDERYKEELTKIMINLHNSYKTINFFVHRPMNYDINGRKEDLQESIDIDNLTLQILKDEGVKFKEITPDININNIVALIEMEAKNDGKA